MVSKLGSKIAKAGAKSIKLPWLRDWRNQHRLSQKEAGSLLRVLGTAYNRWERGKGGPSKSTRSELLILTEDPKDPRLRDFGQRLRATLENEEAPAAPENTQETAEAVASEVSSPTASHPPTSAEICSDTESLRILVSKLNLELLASIGSDRSLNLLPVAESILALLPVQFRVFAGADVPEILNPVWGWSTLVARRVQDIVNIELDSEPFDRLYDDAMKSSQALAELRCRLAQLLVPHSGQSELEFLKQFALGPGIERERNSQQ